MYYNRYQDVLQQINHENSMAEQIRQFNENKAMEQAKLAEQQRQFNAQLAEEKRQYDTTLAWQKSQAAAKSSGGVIGGSIKNSSSGGSNSGNKIKAYTDTGTGNYSKAKAQALKDISRGGVSNYNDAVDILSRCGIKIAKTGTPLLKSSDWNKAKRTGQLGSEFEGVSSYREYLHHYCSWAIKNF
jgi:TolA-binding protein